MTEELNYSGGRGAEKTTMFLRAEVARLTQENTKLRDVNNSTWCAYCDAKYERTDDALEQVRKHIEVCEFHPMRKLESEVDRLTQALRDIDLMASNGMGDYDGTNYAILPPMLTFYDDIRDFIAEKLGVERRAYP